MGFPLVSILGGIGKGVAKVAGPLVKGLPKALSTGVKSVGKGVGALGKAIGGLFKGKPSSNTGNDAIPTNWDGVDPAQVYQVAKKKGFLGIFTGKNKDEIIQTLKDSNGDYTKALQQLQQKQEEKNPVNPYAGIIKGVLVVGGLYAGFKILQNFIPRLRK